MNRIQRDLYEATLDSLTRHPEQWERDRFRAEHRDVPVAVWLANEHYGISVKCADKEIIGGVTVMSSFFGGLIPWRRKLRTAALNVPAAPYPDADAMLKRAIDALRSAA